MRFPKAPRRGLFDENIMPGDDTEGPADIFRRSRFPGVPTLPQPGAEPQASGGNVWGDRLASIASALAAAQAFSSGEPAAGAGIMMTGLQVSQAAAKAKRDAAAAQARAEALIRHGMSPEDAAVLSGDDTALRDKLAPSQKAPYRFEDNAGNVWERDEQTGENKMIFTDMNEKQFVVDGQLVKVPNAMRPQGPSATPAVKPGDIDDGYQFIGGDPRDENSWRPVQGGGDSTVPPHFPPSNIPSGNPLEPYPPRFRR